ncbi:hypothetical protein Taro_019317 [Colocasia esculenta]|uniref:Uncharacterized protein n=1 Tax=Colocasia esculenta TaxID=4460 RepID=A0A843UYU2_COLES|nr:hypothetical protein [Colocasia esculenta]
MHFFLCMMNYIVEVLEVALADGKDFEACKHLLNTVEESLPTTADLGLVELNSYAKCNIQGVDCLNNRKPVDRVLMALASECLQPDYPVTVFTQHPLPKSPNSIISLSQHWAVVHVKCLPRLLTLAKELLIPPSSSRDLTEDVSFSSKLSLSLRVLKLLVSLTKDVPVVGFDVDLLHIVSCFVDALPVLFKLESELECESSTVQSNFGGLLLNLLEEFLQFVHIAFCNGVIFQNVRTGIIASILDALDSSLWRSNRSSSSLKAPVIYCPQIVMHLLKLIRDVKNETSQMLNWKEKFDMDLPDSLSGSESCALSCHENVYLLRYYTCEEHLRIIFPLSRQWVDDLVHLVLFLHSEGVRSRLKGDRLRPTCTKSVVSDMDSVTSHEEEAIFGDLFSEASRPAGSSDGHDQPPVTTPGFSSGQNMPIIAATELLNFLKLCIFSPDWHHTIYDDACKMLHEHHIDGLLSILLCQSCVDDKTSQINCALSSQRSFGHSNVTSEGADLSVAVMNVLHQLHSGEEQVNTAEINCRDVVDDATRETLIVTALDKVDSLRRDHSKAELFKCLLGTGQNACEEVKEYFGGRCVNLLVFVDSLDKCCSETVNLKVLNFFIDLLNSGGYPGLKEDLQKKFIEIDLSSLSLWLEKRLLGCTVEAPAAVISKESSVALREATTNFFTCLISQPCEMISKDVRNWFVEAMLMCLDNAFTLYDISTAKAFFSFLVQLLSGESSMRQFLEGIVMLIEKLADREDLLQGLKFLFGFLGAVLGDYGASKNASDKVSGKLSSSSSFGIEPLVSRQISRKNPESLILPHNQETDSTNVDCDATSADEEDDDDGTSDGELASVDKDEEDDSNSERALASQDAALCVLRFAIVVIVLYILVLVDFSVIVEQEVLEAAVVNLRKAFKSGSFDLKIKAEYTNSRDLKSHLISGSLVKSLFSVSARGRLAVGEGDKVAIFDSSQLVGQPTVAPVTADKTSIKPLSRNLVRFEIVHLVFNPIVESYLAVAGYEECQVLTVNPRGEVTDRLAIELALQGAYVRHVDWVPGSQVHLLVVTNMFVKIYDLSQDNISPIHYFTLADDMIVDATLVAASMGRVCLLVLSELGFLYRLELSMEGDVGAKPLKEIIQVQDGGVQPKGLSLYFSPVLRLLFLSYQDGTTLIGRLDVDATSLTEVSAIYENEQDGKARPAGLHHWKELLVDNGVFVCFSSLKANAALAVSFGSHELFAQNMRYTSGSALPLVGITAYKSLSKDKSHCLALQDDGSLQIYSHVLVGTDAMTNLNLDKAKLGAGILNSKGHVGMNTDFPLDFFEKTICITSEVKLNGDAIKNNDSEGAKQRLQSDDGYLESPSPSGFKEKNPLNSKGAFKEEEEEEEEEEAVDVGEIFFPLVAFLEGRKEGGGGPAKTQLISRLAITVSNPNPDIVMVGIRIQVGNTSVSHIPSDITIFQRVIKLDEGMRSWYDIPFTTAESLLADEEFTISMGPTFDGSTLPRIDSLEIYGRPKDEFGWKEKMDAVLNMEAHVLGSSYGSAGLRKKCQTTQAATVHEQVKDTLRLLGVISTLPKLSSRIGVGGAASGWNLQVGQAGKAFGGPDSPEDDTNYTMAR